MVPLPPETGGAALRRIDGQAWILVDPSFSPAEQKCRLAHELCHLDGGTSIRCQWRNPSTLDVLTVKEELRVDEEVARWLVPDEDLWDLISEMVAAGQDVTARVIAGEFEVTKRIAHLALERFARSGTGYQLTG